ncbi:hypothetical protein D915_000361 [Fasciola hepatica]|uniref:BZIP domain-containing protein n=1 Tax=Fasciola hepatica TaxID=6192 RepID=A0A4E0RYC4_FASHE|nr:hypothetical protein D915_000361 [Fasciola hepatica]
MGEQPGYTPVSVDSQAMLSAPHPSSSSTYSHQASHLSLISSETHHVSSSSASQGNPVSVPSASHPTEHASIELASSITSALLACEQASSFDLPELQDAFMRFFEEGEVSDELDSYFTKVLESVSTQNAHPARSASATESTHIRSPPSRASGLSSTGTNPSDVNQQKLRERRERNNEASRRSRAANKARFQSLIRSIQRLETENLQLTIWLQEVQKAIQEAKDVLLGTETNEDSTQSKSQ